MLILYYNLGIFPESSLKFCNFCHTFFTPTNYYPLLMAMKAKLKEINSFKLLKQMIR